MPAGPRTADGDAEEEVVFPSCLPGALNGGFLLTLERFCSQSFGTKPRSSGQPSSSFSLLFKKKKKNFFFFKLKTIPL